MSNIGNPPCDVGVIRSHRADAPCEQTSRPWVLAATIIGSAMAFIDSTVTNVALPQIQERLGATATDAQWIVESYALFLSALILVGGSLGDHFGRRRIFSLGVIVFTLASVWCGLSTSPEMLIVARAAQGVGGAMLVPGSLAIISTSFEKVNLGGAQVPAQVSEGTAVEIERAIQESFLAGFRLAMFIAAGLAVASAVAAALIIEGKGSTAPGETAGRPEGETAAA
ncbi:MAG TPA: MFS transporter [Rubrobacter sp.]|nr:MFS transporter [Rubrobacter sp.]